jgi:DNA adenine methylase
VPHLRDLWHDHHHQRLLEPFVGGLAVALGLEPKTALLNDINGHLVNFYGWLRKGLVMSQRWPAQPNEEEYYRNRERFNELIAEGQDHQQEAAELFYYLNRTGYNGLCRFNRKGFFNVPFGRYKKITYTYDFSAYADALQNWQFKNTDFQKMELDADDFVYADPPYDVEFRSYSRQGFTWEDQKRLAKWLAAHPGPVVASNQATERIWALYEDLGFKLDKKPGPRRISCTGDRTPAMEMIATKGL